MDNELRELLNQLVQMNRTEQNTVYVDVAPLSKSETDEWRSMLANRESQMKQEERLKQEKKVLKARSEIFWYKVRTCYKVTDVNKLKIDKHANDSSTYYLQKGMCKDKVCDGDGNCDECDINK